MNELRPESQRIERLFCELRDELNARSLHHAVRMETLESNLKDLVSQKPPLNEVAIGNLREDIERIEITFLGVRRHFLEKIGRLAGKNCAAARDYYELVTAQMELQQKAANLKTRRERLEECRNFEKINRAENLQTIEDRLKLQEANATEEAVRGFRSFEVERAESIAPLSIFFHIQFACQKLFSLAAGDRACVKNGTSSKVA